jgi:hypothetical protein
VSTHLSVDAELRAEADRLLESGLRDVLDAFGETHVMGSYALELMTWRDLDIHVVREDLDRGAFFELGRGLATLLTPHRMHYRDETVEQTPGLPPGLYWGIYLGDERKGAWKIDIWATTRSGFEPSQRFQDRIQQRLTPATRERILAIKSACWQHPHYRRDFSSNDIYEAVLDRGVTSVEGFWLQRRVFLR